MFQRRHDLQIFYMENGTVENIDPMRMDVGIKIYYYGISVVNPDEAEGPWEVNGFHTFNETGRYEVHVEFKEKKAHYSVEVRGYGVSTDPAGNEFGTHIQWW